MSYYWLSPTIDDETVIATCPGNGFPFGKELLSILRHSARLPFDLEIRELQIGRHVGLGIPSDLGKPIDFLLNTLSFPIMSERMRVIIEHNLLGTEHMSWRSVVVHDRYTEYLYYFPFFLKKLDVMDEDNSIVVPNSGAIISAAYDAKKLQRYAISHNVSLLWQVPSRLIINEPIKTQSEAEELSGFEAIPIQ